MASWRPFTRFIAALTAALAAAAGAGAAAAQPPRTATAAAVGDPTSDLLFVPVPPCRIIDTRVAGGRIAVAETRAFEVSGTTGFPAQGGNAGGCGVPQGAATPLAAAVMLNLVAVDPVGAGHLVAWQYGEPAPFASAINYQKLDPPLNIANALVVPIAGVSTQPLDLNVQAAVSDVHLVADVVGYFTRFPVETFADSRRSSVQVNTVTTLVAMADGACKELNVCTVTTTVPGQVIVEAGGQLVANHTAGTLDRVAIGVETVEPVACGYDGDGVDASDHEVSAALGTNPDVDFTLFHGRVFSQPGGTTRTYRLSGQWASGANSGDSVENTRMICTFIPD